MRQQPHRSLRHEYELFVEREIEAYKESVSRSVLLSIGDEAVAALAAEQQFALTELILWEEVDRIIMKRIGLPSFQTWRRRRLRRLALAHLIGNRDDDEDDDDEEGGDERRLLKLLVAGRAIRRRRRRRFGLAKLLREAD